MTKKIFHSVLVALAMAQGAMAQNTPLEKYPITPEYMKTVFLDNVQDLTARTVGTGNGQYTGQVNSKNLPCGFGTYMDNSGSKRTGLFHLGHYMFGITQSATSALVGTINDYVSYSLSTGRIEYINCGGQRLAVDGALAGDYAFVSMNYPNGDRYIGEIYKNKRHGYGIYRYTNGEAWWGEYINGIRQGWGCLFRTDGSMRIGLWNGEEERWTRDIPATR